MLLQLFVRNRHALTLTFASLGVVQQSNNICMYTVQAYHIEPRHDAVVLEDCVMVEFEASAAEYYGKMEQ